MRKNGKHEANDGSAQMRDAALLAEQYRALAENSPDLIVRFDRELKHLYVNRAAAAAGILKAEEYIGRTIAETGVPEPLCRVVEDHIRQVFTTRQPVIFDMGFPTPGGNRFFEGRCIPEFGPDGAVKSVLVVSRDITAHKQTEDALRVARDKLDATLNALPDLLFEVDEAGRIYDYRAPHPEQLYAQPETFLGRIVTEVLPPGSADVIMGAIREATAKGKSVGHVYPLLLPGGALRWYELSVATQAQAVVPGQRLVALVHDITARKQAEEALLKAHAELEQKVAERTDQLKRLTMQVVQAEDKERRRIAEILHEDLQQILFAAKFMVSGIGEQTPKVDMQQTVVKVEEMLQQAIESARSLNTALLPPALHEAGLGTAMNWLAGEMKTKHGVTVEVLVDNTAEPTAKEIRGFIFHAVRELLFNVVKHAGVKEAQIQIGPGSNELLCIEVKDNGAGFDVSQSKPGSVGLFIIRERAAFLGGRMEMISNPGQGTCIRLLVPRSKTASASG